MKTMNMFATTCEDLPLLSAARTEPTEGHWNEGGMDGYHNECAIKIRPTIGGEYQVEVLLNDYFLKTFELIGRAYVLDIEQAQAYGIRTANERNLS